MIRKDFVIVTSIGVAIGILAQPILTNVVPVITPALRAGVIIGCTVFSPFALFVAYFLGLRVPALYQFAKFGAVGTLNTLISFGLLNLQSLVFHVTSGMLIPVFATVAFVGATTNSFFWNKFWTFGSRENAHTGEAFKFYLVSFIGWGVNVSTVSFVVNVIPHSGISPEIWLNVGGLCGVAASFLLNFLGYKFWVFKNHSSVPVTLKKKTPEVAQILGE
ncbi:MAG: GtrA family protein [Patescibacteria group bacterium]|nr:GtrA family protein [Patescibacteria group bacterium]